MLPCSNQNSQNCQLGVDRGTSMSTPVGAGAVALVRQYFMQGYYPTGAPVTASVYTPSAPLLKAVVMGKTLHCTAMHCMALLLHCIAWLQYCILRYSVHAGLFPFKRSWLQHLHLLLACFSAHTLGMTLHCFVRMLLPHALSGQSQ